MIFNIIYTPGTVAYLWPLTQTILDHSDFKLRLIGNECSKSEIKFIQDQVINNTRLLSFFVNEGRLMLHHEILNMVYDLDPQEDFFCFMDSDIYSTGMFIKSVVEKMKIYNALFACPPILETPGLRYDGIKNLQGRHFYAHNQHFVGGSYFALYRRLAVDWVFNFYGIKFERKSWNSLSQKIQDILRSQYLVYDNYDTAKVMNILLSLSGVKMSLLQTKLLTHIGGLSWSRSIVDEQPDWDHNYTDIRNKQFVKILQKRRTIAKYFSDLIESFVKRDSLPNMPEMLSAIETNRIKRTTNDLIHIYTKYEIPIIG